MGIDYKIVPLPRFAGGNKVAIVCQSDGSGFKTKTMRLAENFGRWSGRQGGYVTTVKRAELFERLWADGWAGAIMGGFYPPNSRMKIEKLSTVKWYLKHNQYQVKLG